MKNFINTKILIAALVLVALAFPVSAQVIDEGEAAEKEANISKIAQTDNSNNIRKCEQVQGKLSDYLEEAEKANTIYKQDYQLQIDEISNIAIRLKEANDIEPDELIEHIQEMNDLTADLEIMFGQFAASLRSTANIPCSSDSSLDDLKTGLVDVRKLQSELRTTITEIDDLLTGDIIDDLTDLKAATQSSRELSS